MALLTHDHGRHAGFVPGGGSRRSRQTWQAGNLVEVNWRARLADQLGNFSGELPAANAARALDNAAELAGLSAACAIVDAALPERQPHPAMFDGFSAFLGVLGARLFRHMVSLPLGYFRRAPRRRSMSGCDRGSDDLSNSPPTMVWSAQPSGPSSVRRGG